MSTPTTAGALRKCPKCGAPCNATVHMRGGEYGWGTSDLERTTYRYATPSSVESDLLLQALEALESCGAGAVEDGGQQWYDDKLVSAAIDAALAASAPGAELGKDQQ